MACPFCDIGEQLVGENRLSKAFLDGFPSSPGHTLVTPRRHVARLADLGADEAASLWELAMTLVGSMTPMCDSISVGVNDGRAAGQTVGHVHLHLIPRHAGDVEDPRGGIRWVLPETAPYWDKRA